MGFAIILSVINVTLKQLAGRQTILLLIMFEVWITGIIAGLPLIGSK